MNKPIVQVRKKTPTILQMESTECGATALAIIMGFYGKFISSNEARDVCGISRDGSKAINIVKAARNYGMEAHGANFDIEELNQIETPFIVHWEFNHFLVVEGYNSKKVFINDPATGPRTIAWDEFEKNYTGVILSLRPTEHFQKSGKNEISVFSMLFKRFGKNHLPFLFCVLMTIALIIPEIAITIFSKIFIDHILIDQQEYLVPTLIIGILLTIVMTTGLTWIQQWYLLRLKIKLEITNTINFIWHMLNIPIRFFQQRSVGDIVERNSINEKVAKLLSENSPTVVVGIIKIAFFILVMLLLSWQLAVIVLGSVVINFMFLIIMHRNLADIGRRSAQDLGKLNGIEMNGIQVIETLKVAATEEQFFIRWVAFYTNSLNSQQNLFKQDITLKVFPDLLSALTNIIVICFGAFLVIHGEITIGTIVAIQALILMFKNPLNEVLEFVGNLQQTKGDMVRLNDITDTKPDKILELNKKCVQDLKQVRAQYILEMVDVEFGYSKLEPPIFNKLSLKLLPGKHIAVVGTSGSGKSSLIRLICGVYNAWSGKILIAGIRLSSISRKAFSKFLAYVAQDINFFSGTLRENLTLWNEDISDKEIEEALKTTCIYDNVIQRGGLDFIVSEGGKNFSGGQLQCLEIARALLQKPYLLVLDEATSAMDAVLETKIYENLRLQNCSMVVVTHRLSAIRDSDQIYVLEKGTIIQQGRHQDLIKQQGLYKQLVIMEQLQQ